MDVKLDFLNGELEEEVYIKQPKGFLLIDKEDYVWRLKKALYGLKQAHRPWYSHLDRYLHQKGFKKESADKNLYVKVDQDNLTIIEVYVDDVGNNTKKGGELVFSNQYFFHFNNQIYIRYFSEGNWRVHATILKATNVYLVNL